MADTYSWKVATLDREISDGTVYTVHYTVSASRTNPAEGESDYTAGSYGTVGVTADPSSKSFIAYEDLTEDTCIDWVKAGLGSESVDSIEASISSDLDNQVNPIDAAGVPWSTETTTD
jgi:hypothetical protein